MRRRRSRRLCADLDLDAVGVVEAAGKPPGGAVLDHVHHGPTHNLRDLRRQHLPRCGFAAFEAGLVGRVLGEMQALDADRGLPDAVIQDDADQGGECFRPVGRAADCCGEGRNQ